MPRYCLDHRSEPAWGPLNQLAELCGERAGLPELDPREFMYMGCLTADEGHEVHLYKHVGTRRYLNLDSAGHSYGLIASTRTGVVARLLPDLRTALAQVMQLPPPTSACGTKGRLCA